MVAQALSRETTKAKLPTVRPRSPSGPAMGRGTEAHDALPQFIKYPIARRYDRPLLPMRREVGRNTVASLLTRYGVRFISYPPLRWTSSALPEDRSLQQSLALVPCAHRLLQLQQ